MVSEIKTKINAVGSRHTIYLKNSLINDSSFPFKTNEDLTVRIDGEKLIIEKARKE